MRWLRVYSIATLYTAYVPVSSDNRRLFASAKTAKRTYTSFRGTREEQQRRGQHTDTDIRGKATTWSAP